MQMSESQSTGTLLSSGLISSFASFKVSEETDCDTGFLSLCLSIIHWYFVETTGPQATTLGKQAYIDDYSAGSWNCMQKFVCCVMSFAILPWLFVLKTCCSVNQNYTIRPFHNCL